MRLPEYLSPSSLGLWESDRAAFYLKNLADKRPPRIKQEKYMAVGSAFDAYVKAALYQEACETGDTKYEFQALFDSQVEPQNRDWALAAGKYAFDAYVKSGSYAELLDCILASEFPPQFEFSIKKEIYGVPLLGKPDCRYIDMCGSQVVLDWKCTGFCSKSATSPYVGYRLVRDGWDVSEAKTSRGCNIGHKLFKPIVQNGMTIGSHYLEQTCKDWADQLAIYCWMLGVPVGSEDTVVRIEQLVCKPQENKFPLIRVANHVCRISKEWQTGLISRICDCWNAITSGHIFKELSREDSDKQCELLEQQAEGMYVNAGSDSLEEWALSKSRVGNYKR